MADAEGNVTALRLYVADKAPHSVRALENLRIALQGVPPETYSLEVVDALTVPAEAVEYGVVMVPTLVRITAPVAVLPGLLDDARRVLDLLPNGSGNAGAVTHERHLAGDRRIATRARRIHAAVEKLRLLVGDQADMVLDPVLRAPLVLPHAQMEIYTDARNFQRIFEQAPVGIALMSRDFRFVSTNERLCAITGFGQEEMATMGLAELMGCGTDCIPETREKVTACQSGFCAVEMPVHRRDGRTVWLRLSVTMMKDAGGGSGYYLALVQDISDIKAADAELAAHHGRLEELVRQRTEELAAANKRLMQEMEEHMEADEAVRTLNEDLETRVRERTAELEESNKQMERMNSFFVGREVRMAELKEEIARLEQENRALREQRRP